MERGAWLNALTDGRYDKWLKSLKVGDRIEFSGEIFKITGETKSWWKIGKRNFRKRDGKMVGYDGFGDSYIYELTPGVEKQIKEKIMKKYVLSFPYYTLDIETIKKIFIILRDWEKRQEDKNEKP